MTPEKGGAPKDLPQFRDRICVDIVTGDENANEIAQAIANITRTGKLGDGKIFIWTVDEAIRVRTGECGGDALY